MTKVELSAGVTCADDMLYVTQVLQLLGLNVKLPKLLEMDNKGAVHLPKSCSSSCHTRHINVKQ